MHYLFEKLPKACFYFLIVFPKIIPLSPLLFFRSLLMVHQESGSPDEVLEELLRRRKREDAEPLWKNLRLDWVRNWDQNCQTAVLLSRLQHTGRVPMSQPSVNPSMPNTFFFLVVVDMLTLLSASCRVDLL